MHTEIKDWRDPLAFKKVYYQNKEDATRPSISCSLSDCNVCELHNDSCWFYKISTTVNFLRENVLMLLSTAISTGLI